MNSLKLAYQLSQEEEKVPIELEKNNSTGIQCDVCGQSIADFNDVIFLDCHMMCKSHLVENIHREYPVKNMATCGMPSCSYQLSVAEIQAIIGEREFEMLKDKTFQQYIGETGGKLVKCQCGQQTLMEPGVVDYNFKDEQGHQLTREAAVHMAENRFRCPACSTIQCAACGAVPYHLGKSCEEFALFQRSEKCRFCDEIIQPGQSSCPKPECQERMKVSCRKILPCGHRCYGVNGEDQCVPCLHPDCAEKHANLINGANENEFCPICYTEGLGASPVVHLQCGHVIHYECVVSALRNRWVGPRITFNFAK